MSSALPLAGHVAIVAGATRGAGRGVARALGEAGATVYCTGRSVAGSPSAYGRPETIEETAALVTAAGGTGIAVRVDHTREDEVRALVAHVDAEQGRLDVLVSGIAGETPLLGTMGSAFWETDLSRGALALEHTILTHLVAAKHAAPLMIRAKRGLIVELTEGDMLYGGAGVLHEIAKSSLKALASRMAWELRGHRVAAVAVTPGFLRSESMLAHFGVTEATWREGARTDEHFLDSETPLFVGRAVAALAADPDVMRHSGDVTSSWALAGEYGFTDADGSRPDWGTHWRDAVLPSIEWVRELTETHLALLERVAARQRAYLTPESSDPPPAPAPSSAAGSSPTPAPSSA